MNSSRRAVREQGQIGTWLSLTVALLVVAFGTVMLAKLGKGADQASTIQTSADAAALAGAQAIGRDAPGQLVSALNHGGFTCGMGQSAASDFADRNGSTLISYCYHPASDRIDVTVRSQGVTVSGKREEASASAKVGVRLGPCSMPPAPTPSPTPTPTPTSTSSPTPTPTPTDTVGHGSCGDIDVTVTFPGDGGPPTFHWNAAAFKDLVDPRLVQ